MMAINIVLVLVTLSAFVYGYNAQLPKDDFIIVPSNKGHRLAGIQMLGQGNRCDLVRPKIRAFGYCWNDENEKNGLKTDKERGWVREVVQQWEKCGGITIKEEKTCRKGPDFVTVTVGNYHPVVYPEVDLKTCEIKGFRMFISFYTDPGNDYARTEKVRKSVIQMYALHEFGHFLGFDHEHNRNERDQFDPRCESPVDQTNIGPNAVFGTSIITKQFDTDSIMNYCRPMLFYKPYLSQLDIEGVKAKYGGGNQKECEAVTKPWTWGPGEGVNDHTLGQLNGTIPWYPEDRPNGGGGGNNPAPQPQPAPADCADVASRDDCNSRIESCRDEGMKYWCPKTCKYCK